MKAKMPFMHRLFGRIQRASIWFDSRFTSAGQLLVLSLVISTIYALDPRQTSAYLLAATLSACLVVAFSLSFRRPKTLILERVMPSFFTSGEPGSYVVKLENRTATPIDRISLREHLTHPTATITGRTSPQTTQSMGWLERKMGFLPWLNEQRHRLGAKITSSPRHNIPAGATVSINQSITPLRRGVLYFSGTDLRQTETLGLMRRIRHYDRADKVIVLPPRIKLPRVAWQSKRLFHRGGVSVASTVGDSQEFIGLRDYRPGDPLRQVHWRSFAKLGHPVVREFQDEYFDHHALVLDRAIEPGQEAFFEAAISVASSFVQTRQADDSLLDLVMVGDFSWRATAGRGANDKVRLLEHIAVTTASVDVNGTRNDAANFKQQMQKLLNCNSVVFISCKWDTYCKSSISQLRRSGINVLSLRVGEGQYLAEDHHQLDAANITQQLPTLLESLRDTHG